MVNNQKISTQYSVGPKIVQQGSEIWNILDFEWSKRDWVANGPDFEWDLKSGSPTI